MRIAIIGSRTLKIDDIDKYIPDNVEEIVSGGANGVDLCAREYAIKHGVKLVEFLPEYEKYKKNAPLKRNLQIIDYADKVIAFWDGKSRGTKFVIDNCRIKNKDIEVILVKEQSRKTGTITCL